MKHYIIALSLMLTLGLISADAKPRHRHHQPAQTSTVVTPPAQTVADTTVNDEVVAFSDTTSTANVDNTDIWDDEDAISLSPDDYDDPFSWFDAAARSSRPSAIAILVLVVIIFLIVIFLLLVPVIIVILLLRYLVKRHNRNVDMRQQSMNNVANTPGPPPAPDAVMGTDGQVADTEAVVGPASSVSNKNDMWQRGIKNTSIGVGIMALFWIMGAEELVGIGILIACLGVGQMIISKTSK